MATCKKCGQPLAENAVFCHICGTAVEGNIQPERPTRTQVYAGVIKKCPVCGAELPSMAAVCPSCGHEIVSSDMGSFLRAFSESMDKCDQAIVEEEKERHLKAIQNSSGWKSWSKIGKAAWILLNIVTLCLPLVVLYVIKRIRDTLFLPSEKHKISLIGNFEIPNEKGAIIDSLNLIQGKISSITAGSVNGKNWHWVKIWHAKASQIYAKANILLPGEKTTDDIIQQINNKTNSFQKKYSLKKAGLAVLAVLYLLLVVGAVWFLLSRGLIPFAKLTNNGILVSPYLWKVYFPLIVSLCVLTTSKIPSKVKLIIAILPWLAVLVVSCGTRAQVKNEAENEIASSVEEIASKHNFDLIHYEVKNTWDDALEITFQTKSFDRSAIIDAENEIKRVNSDYHYIIELGFVTEDELVIREVKISEHNVISVEEDNTDGFMEEFVNLCKENNLKVDWHNKWNDTYDFTLRPTSNEAKDYTSFAAEAEELMHKYNYSSLEITIRDAHYDDIFRVKIEVGSETEIIQTASIENGIKADISPIIEANALKIDRVSFSNNEVHVELTAQSFDSGIMEKLTEDISPICIETGYDTWIDVEVDGFVVWRIHCDTFGGTTTINAYEITEEVKSVCDKRGIYLEHVGSYGDGLDFRIECGTSSKSTIDSIEKDLVKVYKNSGLKSMAIYFENDKESSLAIRWTVIENDGAVHYATDHTR